MNNAPFYVGQKVVCVKSATGKNASVTEGVKYVVKSIIKNYCGCAVWLVDVGLRNSVPSNRRQCNKCKVTVPTEGTCVIWVNAAFFAPIEPRSVSIPASLKEQAEELISVKETIQEPEKEMA